MKTRIFSATIVLLLFATSALAQFGINAGGAFSSGKAEFDNESNKSDMKTGFTIGVAYRMPIGSTFSFQPELNFLQKGWKETEGGVKDIGTLNYLEVPLYFLYTGNEGNGFYAGAGPSLNFGMSGKYKYTEDGNTEDGDINFGSSEEEMNGFHVGFNAQAGFKFDGGFAVNAFVNQTITNSSNRSDGKLNFFTFGARVGYFLQGPGQANGNKLKQIF